MILRHTCIRAGDDDDLSCQIRDVLYVKLALGRESLTDDRSNNAHVRLGGKGICYTYQPFKHRTAAVMTMMRRRG